VSSKCGNGFRKVRHHFDVLILFMLFDDREEKWIENFAGIVQEYWEKTGNVILRIAHLIHKKEKMG